MRMWLFRQHLAKNMFSGENTGESNVTGSVKTLHVHVFMYLHENGCKV